MKGEEVLYIVHLAIFSVFTLYSSVLLNNNFNKRKEKLISWNTDAPEVL